MGAYCGLVRLTVGLLCLPVRLSDRDGLVLLLSELGQEWAAT